MVLDMTPIDRQAIEELYRAWFDAMEAEEAEPLLELVTDDVVLKGPGSPPVEGKESLREVLQGFHERYSESVEFEVLEAEAHGDWAFARVAESTRLRPKKGGEELEISGQHLSILRRREDGSWRVARDVGSLNHPVGG